MQDIQSRFRKISLYCNAKFISKVKSEGEFQKYENPDPRKVSLRLLATPKDSSVSGIYPNLSVKSDRRKIKLSKNCSINKSLSQTNTSPNLLIKKKLFDNYKELNSYELKEIKQYDDVYYKSSLQYKIKPSDTLKNNGYDTNSGSYKVVEGDHLAYRYEIIAIIGKGSFGIVCECLDHKTKDRVAVKILKNKKAFRDQGEIELDILKTLKHKDPADIQNVIKISSYFLFRNHICIVFDLLSISLRQFLEINLHEGLSLSKIASFSIQILEALVYLESLSIIHCDIKPENFLLTSNTYEKLKLIDFGSSC